MGVFEQFPWTDYNNLNLDWLLKVMKGDHEKVIELEEEIKGLNIEKIINDRFDELIASGYIADIILDHSMALLTPEMYGAAGDGITDDTAAFENMFAEAKAVFLEGGKTYYLPSNITMTAPVYSSGATIKGNGTSLFYKDFCDIENLNLIDCSILPHAEIAAGGAAYLKVSNCRFNTSGGILPVGIRVNAEKSDINNCYFININTGIVYNSGIPSLKAGNGYINLSGIFGYQVYTLIDIEGAGAEPFTDTYYNVNINNVILDTGNLTPPVSQPVGMDAVLASGISKFNISNICSLNAFERALYLSVCDNGNVSNVYAYGSEGAKISGLASRLTRNINLNNLICDNGGFALSIYDAININVNGIKFNGEDNGSSAIWLVRYNSDITLSNILITKAGRGAFVAYNDGSKLTVNNLKIVNMVATHVNAAAAGYAAIRLLGGVGDSLSNIYLEDIKINNDMPILVNYYGVASIINAINVSNLTLDNISGSGYYNATSKPFDLNNCSNVSIKNCKVVDFSTFTYDPADDIGTNSFSANVDFNKWTFNSVWQAVAEAKFNIALPYMDVIAYAPACNNCQIVGKANTPRTLIITGADTCTIVIDANNNPTVISGSGATFNAAGNSISFATNGAHRIGVYYAV